MLDKPYRGNENYIFISYSHKNISEVLRFIEHLQANGYNVWYDEGIDPGTEWDEDIAAHIRNSAYFIAYITKDYIESQNCKDELTYARDLNKERLLIYGEDVELPEGMKMRVNRIQAIYKHKYPYENEFYGKVFQTTGLDSCKTGNTTAEEPNAVSSEQTLIKQGPNTKVIIVAIVVVLAIIVGIFMVTNSKKSSDDSSSPSTPSSSEESDVPEMTTDDTNEVNDSTPTEDLISIKSIEIERQNGEYIGASFTIVNNSDQVLEDVNLLGEDYDKNGNMLEEIAPGGQNKIQPGNEFKIETAWFVEDPESDYTDADVDTILITGYMFNSSDGFFEYKFNKEFGPYSIWKPKVYTFD